MPGIIPNDPKLAPNPKAPATKKLNQQLANSSSPFAGLGTAITEIRTIFDFIGKLGERDTQIRVAEVILGGGLILISLHHLAMSTQIGQTANSLAKRAAEVAAAS